MNTTAAVAPAPTTTRCAACIELAGTGLRCKAHTRLVQVAVLTDGAEVEIFDRSHAMEGCSGRSVLSAVYAVDGRVIAGSLVSYITWKA